jgi:hypothetical protein
MKTSHYIGAVVLLVIGYYVGIKYPNFWSSAVSA